VMESKSSVGSGRAFCEAREATCSMDGSGKAIVVKQVMRELAME
jgi:hypothetical protein